MPEPDCFLRYRISADTWNFTSGKSHWQCAATGPLERAVVLKWFYSLSRRKTFVGGKCALLSALIVCCYFIIEITCICYMCIYLGKNALLFSALVPDVK